MANNTTQINLANEYHLKAMNYAQIAYSNEMLGDKNSALELYEKAYELEKEAALALINVLEFEPSRSILFRSAAALAKKCGQFSDAIQLAQLGLNNNPSSPLLEELNDIIDSLSKTTQIYSQNINEFKLAARTTNVITEDEIEEIKKRFNKDDNEK